MIFIMSMLNARAFTTHLCQSAEFVQHIQGMIPKKCFSFIMRDCSREIVQNVQKLRFLKIPPFEI